MVSATLTDFWGRLAAFNQIRSRAHLPVFICLIADKILMKLMYEKRPALPGLQRCKC